MNTKVLAVVGMTGMAFVASANAEIVLGSFELNENKSFERIFESMSVSLGMVKNGIPTPSNRVFLAENLQLTTADIGTTWVTDPATMEVMRTEMLDSDTRDLFGIMVTLPSLKGGFGVSYFEGPSEGQFPGLGLDLALLASQTDEIRVTLQSFSYDSPGSDPNGDGIWTEYTTSYLFEFVSVPAPSSAALLLTGGVLAGRRKRREG